MKQKVSRVIVMALLLAMTLAVVGCGKKYDSVDDLVASDEMQSEMEEFKTTPNGSLMNLEIKADGEKIIYAYTLNQQVDPEALVESLEAALDEQKDAFSQAAKALKKEVKADNLSVIVQYLNNDGTEIYSREFTAE